MRPCWAAQSAIACHSLDHVHTDHSGCNITPAHKSVFFYTTNWYKVFIRGQPPSTGRPHTGRGGRLRRRAWVRNRVSRWHTHTTFRTYMLSVCLLLLCLKYKVSPTPHFRNKKVTDHHDITDSMEQSPSWESTNHQLAKKFPALCGTRRFVTSFIGSCHQSVSLVRPIQSMPSIHFLKIYFNIILSSTPRSSKWSLSLRYPHQNPASTSPDSHTCYIPSESRSPWVNQPKNILWRV